MVKRVYYNRFTKLFSCRSFSEVTDSELNEFKTLESDSLVPYKITTNESKRPRFANDIIAFLQYGSKKDKDIHLTLHPDSRKYATFKDLDLSNFQYIRKYLMDKGGYEVRLQCRDSDMLATFFSMQIEGKSEVRLAEVPIKLAKDSSQLDFYELIDTFNQFARDMEFFKFYSIKNIFPIRELNEFFIPRNPGSNLEISFSKKRIMASLTVGNQVILSVTFNKDNTLNLTIDEGKLQRALPRDRYELMIDRIMKTERMGFKSVKVELLNATNIYQSLTTVYKRLKSDTDPYTFNTYQ